MKACERLLIEARFVKYLVKMPNGCEIWTGAQSKGGRGKENRKARGGPYGSFRVNRDIGPRRAHIVWAWLRGKLDAPTVPPGMNLDHECESGTLCVTCTKLIPESVNRSLSKTRRRDGIAEAAAKERAATARRNRRRREARKRKAGHPKSSPAAK